MLTSVSQNFLLIKSVIYFCAPEDVLQTKSYTPTGSRRQLSQRSLLTVLKFPVSQSPLNL
jgi:hypothetical protein